MTTNAEKASALLANVRALKPPSSPPSNKLGLKFFDELGPPLTLEQAKAVHVQNVLHELDWQISKAAVALAVSRTTVHRMIKRYELERGVMREFDRRRV